MMKAGNPPSVRRPRYGSILLLAVTCLALGGAVAALVALGPVGSGGRSENVRIHPALLGRSAFEDAKLNEALQYLEQAINRPADVGSDRQTKLLYGRTLGMLGRISQAEAFLADMIKRNPDDTSAMTTLSEIFEASGDLDQALCYAVPAARLQPDNAYLWRRLALLQVKAGQGLEAMASIQRSLQLDPGQEDLTRLRASLASRPPWISELLPSDMGSRPRRSQIGMIPGMPHIPDPRSMVPAPRSSRRDPQGRSGSPVGESGPGRPRDP